MTEAQTATQTAAQAKPAKATREVEVVNMKDGRKVEFVGKRKLLKETTIADGKVTVRLDFRNGDSRLFTIPDSLLLKSAGHGAEQKLGDQCAGVEKVDDMVLAIDDLIAQLNAGNWTAPAAEGSGFSGASVVIKAIMQMYGKTQDEVKAFLQGKLDAAKAKGETLSRAKMYESFRNPTTKIGKLIEKLEREDRAGKASFNADEALADLGKPA